MTDSDLLARRFDHLEADKFRLEREAYDRKKENEYERKRLEAAYRSMEFELKDIQESSQARIKKLREGLGAIVVLASTTEGASDIAALAEQVLERDKE